MVVCPADAVNGSTRERHNRRMDGDGGTSLDDDSALVDTLIELMELPGPTGQEEPVLAWCRGRWSALGARISVAPVGNVLAHVGGRGPRLLLQGHADEIGFVVKSIDGRGFVWLDNGQGGGGRFFHDRYPVGQPALVIGRRAHVPGVFATPTGHILTTRPQEPGRLGANDLFVDVGASSRAEAEALGVHVGAGVIWNPPTRRLGRRLFGKAIDDRVALALITHLMGRVAPDELCYDLTVAATVQEEIGLVGATALGTPGQFDLAIALDNGPIGDYPGVDAREMPVHLGHGPTLVYKDGWVHYDRRIISRLLEIADDRDIPVQQSTFPGFGSDGAALIKAGIPTALLGLATRYTHSAFEMVDECDLSGALALLRAFVTTPAKEMPLGPS
jgi:tetrahedral aminopeptidase